MYATVFGQCVACKKLFGFNPNRVPSFPIDGIREPICRECFNELNTRRIKQNMEAFPLHSDAYEPISSNEI
jgi:hypothetical protein